MRNDTGLRRVRGPISEHYTQRTLHSVDALCALPSPDLASTNTDLTDSSNGLLCAVELWPKKLYGHRVMDSGGRQRSTPSPDPNYPKPTREAIGPVSNPNVGQAPTIRVAHRVLIVMQTRFIYTARAVRRRPDGRRQGRSSLPQTNSLRSTSRRIRS